MTMCITGRQSTCLLNNCINVAVMLSFSKKNYWLSSSCQTLYDNYICEILRAHLKSVSKVTGETVRKGRLCFPILNMNQLNIALLWVVLNSVHFICVVCVFFSEETTCLSDVWFRLLLAIYSCCIHSVIVKRQLGLARSKLEYSNTVAILLSPLPPRKR